MADEWILPLEEQMISHYIIEQRLVVQMAQCCHEMSHYHMALQLQLQLVQHQRPHEDLPHYHTELFHFTLLYRDILRLASMVYAEARRGNCVGVTAVAVPASAGKFGKSVTFVISIFEAVHAKYCSFVDGAVVASKH